jgi:putative lipoic acid-binding regulatory protein
MKGEPRPTESALALLDYPNRYPLKVFGKPSDDFEATVLGLVRARCPQAEHIEVRRRSSSGGKYLALTLTFTVHTQRQLEEIYRDLHECDQVLMSL